MVQDVQSFETAEHSLAATEVSEVAFLGKEILDTVRSSKSKGTLLLQFLFDHVIPLSPADLEYRSNPMFLQKVTRSALSSMDGSSQEQKMGLRK